ncbi:tyramine receptor Ser-2 [Biomphalaria pfeifferi]|uniref:Tyramine receptor Ser-2 n=1 Tax=Biomphalaria pfeifferi TaxID=112525 RepID=A0AAD8B0M8_BIOPF|nr:tyramine receptor Ser-2 [Biomphalaria pfeifferi]
MSTPTLQSNESGYYTKEEIQEYLALLQHQSNIAFIPTYLYLAVFIVVGCVGNCLVIVVYSTKLIRTPLRIFIVSMAIFDLLTNLFVMPAKLHELSDMWDSDKPTLCKVQKYLNSSFVVTSAFILVAIATTRYKMVCHSFGKQVTIKQAKIISVILALSAFIISIPYGIIHGTQTKETPNKNISGRYCQVDDSYVKTIWPRLNSGLFILLFLVCSSLITVFYVLIGRTTWKQRDALTKVQPKPSGKSDKSTDSCTLSSDEKYTYSRTGGTSDTSDTEVVAESNDGNIEIAMVGNIKSKQTNEIANHADENSGYSKSDRDVKLATKKVNKSENKNTYTADTQINKILSYKNAKFFKLHRKKMQELGTAHKESINKNKTGLQKASNKQRRLFGRTSLMMFIVTLVFFVGFLPFLGLNVFLAISPQKVAALEGASLALYQLFLCSYLLNSFANPIVYSLLDMRFRKECFKFFKRSRKKYHC